MSDEQQTQAGEPNVMAIVYESAPVKQQGETVKAAFLLDKAVPTGSQLITLQSHREAMDGVKSRAVELLSQGQEALSKKDAKEQKLRQTLQACVEALEIADKFCGTHTADECHDTVALPIKDAIIKAQEALN